MIPCPMHPNGCPDDCPADELDAFLWRTKDGVTMRVRDMDERHLKNSIRVLQSVLGAWTGEWRQRRIAMLVAELDTRICQIHRADVGDEPTDCQIEEVGRACSALRHGANYFPRRHLLEKMQKAAAATPAAQVPTAPSHPLSQLEDLLRRLERARRIP